MNGAILNDEHTTGCPRTAILIRCTEAEANMVRSEAAREHLSISRYVLAALERNIRTEEPSVIGINPTRKALGPRKALLIRCSVEDHHRIRLIARRQGMSINSFVLQCLRWSGNTDRHAGTNHQSPSQATGIEPTETTGRIGRYKSQSSLPIPRLSRRKIH